MSSKKSKAAPLPASSGGLMRFFEDETKGWRVNPKIIVTIPISLIIVSWLIDIFLAPLKDNAKRLR
ncbi:MAG: preprotein translocase subunit Sec61beta [Nitrosopumilus sp.]|nr:preprotein translocase subunit Sec61beta [Nitrosopumilus sp.]